MEDAEFPEYEEDVIGVIDWDSLFDELPEGTNSLFPVESLVLTDSSSGEARSDPSPDPVSSWIGEIETILMKDEEEEEEEKVAAEPSKEFCDSFLAEVVLDSPGEVSGVNDKDSSSASNDGNGDWGKENVLNNDNDGHSQDDANDPFSKKRRRQLRNRDAAVRSRERKKMYVSDLEMKSRYLEGECRRLGRLLQGCYAENHALRLSLQSGNAFGAPMTKQESAVLLLESLLLGSLLWFLGIMCLLSLPAMAQLVLGRVPLENAEKKNPGVRGARSKMFGYLMAQSFVKSRRCKASRTKMKPISLVL